MAKLCHAVLLILLLCHCKYLLDELFFAKDSALYLFVSLIVKEAITDRYLIYHLQLSCHSCLSVRIYSRLLTGLCVTALDWVDKFKFSEPEPVSLFPSKKICQRTCQWVCLKCPAVCDSKRLENWSVFVEVMKLEYTAGFRWCFVSFSWLVFFVHVGFCKSCHYYSHASDWKDLSCTSSETRAVFFYSIRFNPGVYLVVLFYQPGKKSAE